MSGQDGAEVSNRKPPNSISSWQQGDYSTSIRDFLASDTLEQGVLAAALYDVAGVIVVSQTCDIANISSGKEFVTVCPLVELTAESLREVTSGRTPAYVLLEHPPTLNIVADLGRMMSIHKSILETIDRNEGFTTDQGRVKFAQALERKHGRFAFPDSFSNDVLRKLRERPLSSHDKANSPNGKSYRSIRYVRVAGLPNWDAQDVEVFFHFVLHEETAREASRSEISKTLDDHFDKINWPTGFRKADPAYQLITLAEMTAAEWVTSQPIDWDFISYSNKITNPER